MRPFLKIEAKQTHFSWRSLCTETGQVKKLLGKVKRLKLLGKAGLRSSYGRRRPFCCFMFFLRDLGLSDSCFKLNLAFPVKDGPSYMETDGGPSS